MPDYIKMYYTLFRAQAKTIEILQKAHQEAEKIYILGKDIEIKTLDGTACKEKDIKDKP